MSCCTSACDTCIQAAIIRSAFMLKYILTNPFSLSPSRIMDLDCRQKNFFTEVHDIVCAVNLVIEMNDTVRIGSVVYAKH